MRSRDLRVRGPWAAVIQCSAFVRKELAEIVRQPRLILLLIFGPFALLMLFGVGLPQREPRAEDHVRRPAGLVLRGRHRRVPRRARALRRPSRVHRRRGGRPRRARGRRPRRRRRVPRGSFGPGAGGRERRDRGPAQQDRPDPDDRRRHRFPAGGPGSQRLGVDRGGRRVTVRAPPRRRTGDGPVRRGG